MNSPPICAVLLLAGFLIQTSAASSQGEESLLSYDMIRESAKEARELVDSAYSKTRKDLKVRAKRANARISDLRAFCNQAVGGARNSARTADYKDFTMMLVEEKLKCLYPGASNVSDYLTEEQKEIIDQLTGCAYLYLPKVCDPTPYRTITGVCNNRKHSYYGSANIAFIRLLPANYEDNRSVPLGWTPGSTHNGYSLPPARDVSIVIARVSANPIEYDPERGVMFMQWGQLLDHDVTFSVSSPTSSPYTGNVDCNSCETTGPCFPIVYPPHDPRYNNGQKCIPLIRTAAACSLTDPRRNQLNGRSSFIDAGPVYGNDMNLANALRNRTNDLGLLAINQNISDNGLPLLPHDTSSPDPCSIADPVVKGPCFLAGDSRVNEQTMLTAFHTLFMREHNHLATQMHEMNPHWSGDKIYNEVRKIIGAIFQKITYIEWLPLLLGDHMSEWIPPYTGYDEDVNPGTSNVFTQIFRVGHTMVPQDMYLVAEDYTTVSKIPIYRTFFSAFPIITGGIDPILRGMMLYNAKLNRQDQIMVDTLRESLYPVLNDYGADLAATNVQRGRDHGMPGYIAWRSHCGLSVPMDVHELAAVMDSTEQAEKFMKLYNMTDNIEIWPAGVSEPHVPNGKVGEAIGCLIGDQFRRIRDGDRYFYQNRGVFTQGQLEAIEGVSISSIICANTNIREVPRNPFLGNDYQDFMDCSNFSPMDISSWESPEFGDSFD